MTVGAASSRTSILVRRAEVGGLLPAHVLGERSSRRIEATALVQPGAGGLADYLASIEDGRADFAAWDGRLHVLPTDDEPTHRLLIVDRYGQVYEATDSADAAGLPDAAALREWFKFLATACPECGVLDDPTDRDWVP